MEVATTEPFLTSFLLWIKHARLNDSPEERSRSSGITLPKAARQLLPTPNHCAHAHGGFTEPPKARKHLTTPKSSAK